MVFTYDLSTDVGRVRRTIPDKISTDYIWEDAEIESFISDEGNWRRATALALETMASDDLLVLKVLRIHDIETNTDRMVDQLLKRAAKLRDQAAQDDANAADGGDFDVITIITDDHQYAETVRNAALRGTI